MHMATPHEPQVIITLVIQALQSCLGLPPIIFPMLETLPAQSIVRLSH